MGMFVAGRAYRIKEIDGQLCLIHDPSGRVVFQLYFVSGDLNFSPDTAASMDAVFYLAEPSKEVPNGH